MAYGLNAYSCHPLNALIDIEFNVTSLPYFNQLFTTLLMFKNKTSL